MLQSAVLGVGAYLVIHQEASGGIIIAGSILSARALAPVDIAISHWRGFVAARQSWDRLRRLLATVPPETEPMPLQPPHKSLVVENANVVPPGEQKPVVCDLSLKLQRGNGLGVMAPALPVSHRSPACWSDIGRPGRARSALTALHCINGLRIYWDALLAICRSMSNCSPAPWRKTSAVSNSMPIRPRYGRQQRPPASTI
jgi:hypothetical protein